MEFPMEMISKTMNSSLAKPFGKAEDKRVSTSFSSSIQKEE